MGELGEDAQPVAPRGCSGHTPRSPLEPRWQNTWGHFLSPYGSPITPHPRQAPPPAHLATSATPPLSPPTASKSALS